MSDDAGQVAPEATDVPATDPAATTDPVATPGAETPAPQEENPEAAKSFTQAELDAIVQKEKAKAEAKAYRRAARESREAFQQSLTVQQPPAQQADQMPKRENFASDEDWLNARDDWRDQKRVQEARQAQMQNQTRQVVSRTESLYAEAQKLPGFDREEFDQLPITQAMAASLLESDVAPKVMAFMQSNPAEVERISKLSPARQAAEIGKIEDKVSAAPAVSRAPPPIKPVGARGAASNGDLSRMSMDEYKAMRAKQGARWA